MSKHVHDMEYGQSASDVMKKVIQMRCNGCGYSSYTLFRTWPELLRAHPELVDKSND